MKLADTGQVYVTDRAAQTYADAMGLRPSEARRELTERLHEATSTEEGRAADPEKWRYRSRTTGIDISAMVSREERMAVVVSVNVRRLNVGGQRPQKGLDR